jgi:hypothetical protein
MTRRILLVCGILSSALYVAIDVMGALSYPGYDYAGQAISELSAVGAPTAGQLAPFQFVYALLFTAFATGVWAAAGKSRALRVSGGLLLVVGLLGLLAWPFFPMHMRGADRSFVDTMHLALGALDILLLVLAIAFATRAFGARFRIYSWATIVAMLVFGGLTALYVPRVDAGLPTPYLGVLERISFAAYLLWIAVLSVALLRSVPRQASRIVLGGEAR